MKYRTTLLLITALLLYSQTVFAGGVIKLEENARGKGKSTTVIYLTDNFLRMDFSGNVKDNSIIIDLSKDIILSIDNKLKTYIELTKSDIEKLKTILGNANSKMENAEGENNKAPNENSLPGGDELKYVKSSSVNQLGNWKCDKYEALKGTDLISEIWTINWKDSGLKNEYYESLKKLHESLNVFSEKLGITAGVNNFGLAGEKNFPIKSVDYEGKLTVRTSEVKEITEQEIPAKMFELPQGLTKKNLQMLKNK